MKEPLAIFSSCPLCRGGQFYLSKDFNKTLGFALLGISIVLVPWTYGLSLPVLALIDWILYKKVPMIANCYRCGSIFRGFHLPEALKPFDHHTAIQYPRFRK